MTTKTTKETVNSRILRLKTLLDLGQNEFCSAAKISTATFHSIKNEIDIRPRTVRNICEALGANQDWVFKGEGEPFTEKTATSPVGNPWESETYKAQLNLIEEIRGERDRLIKQLDFYTGIFANIAKGEVNFLKLINKTTLSKVG